MRSDINKATQNWVRTFAVRESIYIEESIPQRERASRDRLIIGIKTNKLRLDQAMFVSIRCGGKRVGNGGINVGIVPMKRSDDLIE